MPGSYYSDAERTIFLTYVILCEDISKYDELFQAERKFISFEFWNDYLPHQLDYDDLVYGHELLSEIVEKIPATREGLTRFLYSIVLRRMEIRDKSVSIKRSLHSVVVSSYVCIDRGLSIPLMLCSTSTVSDLPVHHSWITTLRSSISEEGKEGIYQG